MRIIVRPSDLIKRFIWDRYVHFCLDGKKSDEINSLIDRDQEFAISEEDAFVIGLTNVIYTNEVIYKFKQFLRETLENKKFVNDKDKREYINRQFLLDSINTFRNKVPKRWVSDDPEFKAQLERLPKIFVSFTEGVNKLTPLMYQDWPCVKYAQAKKLINKIV